MRIDMLMLHKTLRTFIYMKCQSVSKYSIHWKARLRQKHAPRHPFTDTSTLFEHSSMTKEPMSTCKICLVRQPSTQHQQMGTRKSYKVEQVQHCKCSSALTLYREELCQPQFLKSHYSDSQVCFQQSIWILNPNCGKIRITETFVLKIS